MLKKIEIAIPTRDSNALIPASMAKSIMAIKQLPTHTASITFSYAQPVDANRNRIIENFLKRGEEYEWLLMIDDDCPVPNNVLDLITHGEPIVSGVIIGMMRGIPYPIIMKETKDGKAYSIMKETEFNKQKGRLVEVEGTGMGCMAMRRDALKKMKKPWFKFEYMESGDIKLGEDYWFCKKARKEGYKLYVDTGVHVGHIKSIDLLQMNRLLYKMATKGKVTGKFKSEE